ncbi:DUF935 domain-containing protein [Marinobacter subterrani]|uniref:Mu-like prophage protein gp29 n=1 Tax=Marinobacter subterrani TaxID=1658765 RepID=A0A0J7JAY7_9GAMM|nr:DUF935 domain-containing protein [Marinobacter subterrani]KMQ75337.1 Mu-like prophage protein gp29 [Marinobacter subterrani]
MVNGLKRLAGRLFGDDGEGKEDLGKALEEQQTQEARVGILRREFAEHPTKGLTPARLYEILEAAEHGDPKAQHELFEDMEEKDPQIGADLGKRRQLAAELEWQIVPPDGASSAERKAAEHAAEVFSSLEVEDLILDMGSAIGHGFSNLELSWGRDGSLRYIEQPQLRPQSWFRLHPDDQNQLTLRDMSLTGAPLWPLGWVQHRHKAKPGYIARSGLHRMLVWPYLFQNYALGDLAQLLEIYGMPARVGKYPRNASDKEKATLLRAVVTLGQNAAGIIPEGMAIDFLEAAQGRADVYVAMMNWCERAKAKAILGGTLTSGTGEGTNTNALGNVHERGQASLIRSDVRQYAGTIRRDILWPMACLNYGIEKVNRAPRFYLDMGETEDYKTLSESLPVFVDMGARIPTWWLHERTGIPRAADDDEVLQPKQKPEAPGLSVLRQALTAQPDTPQPIAALRQDEPNLDGEEQAAQLETLAKAAAEAETAQVEAIRQAVEQAESLEDLRDRLVELSASLPIGNLAEVMGDALAAAQLAGRADLLDEVR